MRLLLQRPWHGNIRELKSFIERTVILYDESMPLFSLEAYSDQQGKKQAQEKGSVEPEADGPAGDALFDSLPSMDDLQRQYIRHVLTLTRGRIDGENGALKILGMKRSTLYAKMKEYGLDKASLLYGPRSPG